MGSDRIRKIYSFENIKATDELILYFEFKFFLKALVIKPFK